MSGISQIYEKNLSSPINNEYQNKLYNEIVANDRQIEQIQQKMQILENNLILTLQSQQNPNNDQLVIQNYDLQIQGLKNENLRLQLTMRQQNQCLEHWINENEQAAHELQMKEKELQDILTSLKDQNLKNDTLKVENEKLMALLATKDKQSQSGSNAYTILLNEI